MKLSLWTPVVTGAFSISVKTNAVESLKSNSISTEPAEPRTDSLPKYGARLGEPVQIQPIANPSEIGQTMVYYGDIDFAKRSESEQKMVVAQQETILKRIQEKGAKLQAWEWQHFVTSELKRRGLTVLDPESVGTTGFSIEDFKKSINEAQ